MQVAYNITRGFGDPNMAYTYDQRAILFTSKPISVPNVSKHNCLCTLSPKYITHYPRAVIGPKGSNGGIHNNGTQKQEDKNETSKTGGHERDDVS